VVFAEAAASSIEAAFYTIPGLVVTLLAHVVYCTVRIECELAPTPQSH